MTTIRTESASAVQLRSRHALRVGAGFLIISLIIGYMFLSNQADVGWFPQGERRFADGISLGAICILLALLITSATSIISYRLYSLEMDSERGIVHLASHGRYFYIGRVAISFVVTFAVIVLTTLTFFLIEAMFTDARITTLLALVIVTLFGGVLGFAIAFYVSGLGNNQLMNLLAVVLIIGLCVSFLLADTQDWWQYSVSYLGYDTSSNLFFNLSIIIVGIIALTLSRDITDDLIVLVEQDKFPRRSFVILRAGLILIGVGIVGIGIFPIEINPISYALHNISSHSMAVVLIAGMLFLRWIAPNVYPDDFLRISILLGLLCIGALLAYFILLAINFVTLELILFAVFVIWIFLFKLYTERYVHQKMTTP